MVGMFCALCAFLTPSIAAPLTDFELEKLRETVVRDGKQVPSDFALRLAERVGREFDIDNFRLVVALRRPALTRRASEGHRANSRGVAPPYVDIIVQNYGDRDQRAALLTLIVDDPPTDLPVLGTAERVAAYARRNDPAGYLTALGFAAERWAERNFGGRRQGLPYPELHVASWSARDRALARDAEALLARQDKAAATRTR